MFMAAGSPHIYEWLPIIILEDGDAGKFQGQEQDFPEFRRIKVIKFTAL
jgi:hypothetical protein